MKFPKIIYRYISIHLLINFIAGASIFTAILFSINMARLTDWLSSGAPLSLIFKMFIYIFPYLLSSCIPIAFLTSIILVFGRLSHDNEITAMRASGISIYQIAAPVILSGLLLSLLLIPLNNEVLAKTHFLFRKTIYSLGLQNPTAYLESGSFVDIFPGYNIFIKKKDETHLYGVVIYQNMENNKTRTITAKSGEIYLDQETLELKMSLNDGNISEPKDIENEFLSIKFGHYELAIDASNIIKDPSTISKKHKNMTIHELRQKITEFKAKKLNIAPFLTEIHKKLSISFSCLVFALIGIPLGIQAHRTEKTIGAGISLLVALAYYLMIIFGKAVDDQPQLYPHLLMWLPTLFIGTAGIILLRRIARH